MFPYQPQLCEPSKIFSNLQGPRSSGAIGDVIVNISYNSDFYYFRWIFDLLSFIIINLILMNMVFGTIIDSFAGKHDQELKSDS